MFWTRAIVTATMGPLALLLVYLGGLYYFIPISIILVMGVFEYSHMMEKMGWKTAWWILLPATILLLADGHWVQYDLEAPFLLISLLAAMIYALWQYETQQSEHVSTNWLVMIAGIMLLGWLGSHFFRLRSLPLPGDLAWQWSVFTMVTIWGADSFAYMVGKRIGKRKLCPRLSPNKTIEGYIAGILGGLFLALIVTLIFQLPFDLALFLAFIIATVAPLGDLGISLLKREANVKDSGHFLPGHGGSLDRTDSLVWAVAIAYYYLLYLQL